MDSRRSLLKKAAYMAPAIITLKAVPSFASGGSGHQGDQGGQGHQGDQGGQGGQGGD
jgi:hypothetical protein